MTQEEASVYSWVWSLVQGCIKCFCARKRPKLSNILKTLQIYFFKAAPHDSFHQCILMWSFKWAVPFFLTLFLDPHYKACIKNICLMFSYFSFQILAIFAFATTTSYSSRLIFDVYCCPEGKICESVEQTVKWSYPFRWVFLDYHFMDLSQLWNKRPWGIRLNMLYLKETVPRKSIWALNVHFSKTITTVPFILVWNTC